MAATAKKGGYTITVTAVDRASKAIADINKRLAATQAPVKRLTAQMARFSEVSGLQRMRQGFAALASHAANAARSLASVVPGLGAITGAATIAGMAKLVTSWGDLGTKLLNSSQRLGMSAAELSDLQGAAELAGVPAEALTGSLEGLSDVMQDAVAGKNGDALRMFSLIGVGIHESAHKAKPAAAILGDLADRFKKLSNAPRVQAQLARQLGVEALLPLLVKGREGIEEYRRKAQELNPVTDASVRNADRLREAQTGLKPAFQGVGNAIALHVGLQARPEPKASFRISVLASVLSRIPWCSWDSSLIQYVNTENTNVQHRRSDSFCFGGGEVAPLFSVFPYGPYSPRPCRPKGAGPPP